MEELQRIAGELNKRLQDIGEELLLIEEAVALTLYTGPMFEKHYVFLLFFRSEEVHRVNR
jgi:hypothetical protein